MRRKTRDRETALTRAILNALDRSGDRGEWKHRAIKAEDTIRQIQAELDAPMPDNVRELIAEVDDQCWKALRVAQQEDRTIKTVTEDYGFLVRVRNEIMSHYKQEPTIVYGYSPNPTEGDTQ